MNRLTPKKNNLKFVIANFQGMRSKKEVIAEMLQSTNPDVVIGVESHLDGDTGNSEVFPTQYSSQAHRHDRTGKK